MLYAITNADKIGRALGVVFPPVLKLFEKQAEDVRKAKRDELDRQTEQYTAMFEIVKETISWMRQDFRDLMAKIDTLNQNTTKLQYAIDRNNALTTAFNVSITEMSDRILVLIDKVGTGGQYLKSPRRGEQTTVIDRSGGNHET